jgi:nucleoside-diphosphate-sugar epimerase
VTILVVGAAGFVGRHLVQRMRDDPSRSLEIVGLDLVETSDPNVRFIQADAADPDVAKSVIGSVSPDRIVNLSGRWGKTTVRDLMESNVVVTDAILSAVREISPETRVVVLGSAAEYGAPNRLPVRECDEARPLTPYGVAKLMQTILCEYYRTSCQLDTVVARLFNVIGTGQSETLSVGSFYRQLQDATDGAEIRTGNLNSRRDFLDVADVCDAIMHLVNPQVPAGIYNVCSGVSVTIADLVKAMVKASKAAVALRTEESRVRAKDVPEIYGDFTRLREATGWTPRTPLSESIRRLFP